MKYFLPLILLLFTLLPAGAVKKVDANPINVAVVIVEKGDSTKIASLFDYYGYEKQGIENGRQLMRTANGHKIKYTFQQDEVKPSRYPTIVVKTNVTQKEIETTLKELKFIKVGNAYDRSISRYHNYITRCSLGPNNTLILQRIQTQTDR